MEGRYDEPDELKPDPALLDHYLWQAFPNHHVAEQERVAATAALLQLYRDQREQVRGGQRLEIDPRLIAFVRDTLQRCIRQPDPLCAIERLLNSKPSRPRGRPATPHRDFVIAGDIEEKIEGGATVEEACEQLEREGKTDLHYDQLRRIYFAQKKQDEAGLRWDLKRRQAEPGSLNRARSLLVHVLVAMLNTVRADLVYLLKNKDPGQGAP
jgi:hypothetical protein